jgi:hypothetical protein
MVRHLFRQAKAAANSGARCLGSCVICSGSTVWDRASSVPATLSGIVRHLFRQHCLGSCVICSGHTVWDRASSVPAALSGIVHYLFRQLCLGISEPAVDLRPYGAVRQEVLWLRPPRTAADAASTPLPRRAIARSNGATGRQPPPTRASPQLPRCRARRAGLRPASGEAEGDSRRLIRITGGDLLARRSGWPGLAGRPDRAGTVSRESRLAGWLAPVGRDTGAPSARPSPCQWAAPSR